jgi:hypothetical protein
LVTTAVNVLQVLLLGLVVWTFARRARALLFAGRLDRKLFAGALREALGAGQRELARSLARACLPAWPARMAVHGLEAIETRANLHAVLEEQRLDLLHAAPAGIATLRSLARMATPLAFIGVISELGRALGGGYGLAGLQRGLPERMAIERGLLTFALGIGTTVLALAAARVLARGVEELARAANDVAAVLAADRRDLEHARM